MSERTARVDQLLREEISAIIGREIADPRIGFVTVTDVDVTRDLSHAIVWVSIIGDEATRKESMRSLGRAMPFIRHRLGVLRLRRIPDLHLREDDSAERGTRVLRLLDEIEQGVDAVPGVIAEPLPTPVPVRGVPEPAKPRRKRTTAPPPARPRDRPKHGR